MAETFFIFLDSRNKTSGSNTNFSLDLNGFNVQPGVDVSISVDNVTFFNMQYPINSSNNQIIFQENDVASNLIATIPEGSYTGSEIADVIKTQLEAVGANTYTVSYDGNNGKLTVSTVLPDNFRFISISEIYGYTDPSSSFLATETGNYAVNLAGYEYVDLLLPNMVSSNMTSNFNNNGIVHRVPLFTSWGSLIQYQSQESDDSIIINHEYLHHVRVQMRNPNGSYYDLPDNSYLSVVLKCEFKR